MKKLTHNPLFLAAIIAVVFVFNSCSHDSGSDLPETTASSTPFNYNYLTANRKFIGGSLIYDPSDNSGKLAQIASGTKIGVRLGKLTKKEKAVTSFASGTQFITSSASDDTASALAEDPTSGVSITTNVSGGASATKFIYEDIPDQAIYGYISINDIRPESVSLTFTKVTASNGSFSNLFTLKQGESADLNGDGHADLKWTAPPLKRSGYSENSRWLTFINEENTEYSAMFYKFSDSEVRAGYRSILGETESFEKGLYGVNSNGDFVWVFYDEPEIDSIMAYGDYILCLPSKTGLSEENISEIGEFTGPSLNDESTENNEFYDGIENMNFTNSDINFGGKSYVVTSTTANTYNDIEEFSNYSIDYSYYDWQFPDPVNGPKALIADLCAYQPIKDFLQNGENSTLENLNAALTEDVFIENVLAAKNVSEDKKSVFNTSWTSAATFTEKQKYARTLIDTMYDSSPSALIESPELTNIYPDMCLNIGSLETLGDFMYSGASDMMVEIENPSSRAIHSKYADYQKKHKEMEKVWKNFYNIDLSQIILFPATKGKTLKISPKSAGMYLGAGLKASCSISKSNAAFGLGLAVWLDLDITINSLNVILDQLGKGGIKEANESNNIKLAELLMELFGDKVKKLEIKVADVNINVCGVPLVFGTAIKTGINFSLGNYNPHLCFSGMYGADVNFGASYGVDWFLSPYFTPYASGRPINYTEFYAGLEDSSASSTNITFEPWFSFIPSVGLGTSAVSARLSLPLKAGFHSVISVPNVAIKEMGVLLGINFQPYIEADLKVVKIKKDFCNLPIVNHNLIFYPTPVRWERRK